MAARGPPIENEDQTNVMTNLTNAQIKDLFAELAVIRQERKQTEKKQLYPLKLDPFRHSLGELAKGGATLAELKAWLETQGVRAGLSTIWRTIQQDQPSKLDPYRKPLVRLTKAGASLDDLKAWLKAQGVQAERTAIWMAVRRWDRAQDEPHFLSPNWKPARTSARSREPASKSVKTPSSHHKQ